MPSIASCSDGRAQAVSRCGSPASTVNFAIGTAVVRTSMALWAVMFFNTYTAIFCA